SIQYMGGQFHHVLLYPQLRYALKKLFIIANLVVVAQRGSKHALVLRFYRKNVFTVSKHNPRERHSTFVLHCIPNYGEGFFATPIVGNDVVRPLVVSFVDLLLWHKLIDIDRSRAFDFHGFQLIGFSLDVAAAPEFIAARLILSFDNAASLFIDHLLTK